MSQVDWSKAPEGATHYAPKIEDNDMWCAVFWRVVDRIGVEAWQVDDHTGRLNHCRHPTWIPETFNRLIPRPTEWPVTGLPPAGTVCEVLHSGHDTWTQHRINYIGGELGMVVFQGKASDEFACPVRSCQFRPIRTPEQIAAEEREKAIAEMLTSTNCSGRPWIEKFGELYDAGWRKADAPEQ